MPDTPQPGRLCHTRRPASDDGDLNFGFSAELEYDTPYSFDFWLSAESHAAAVPEPGTLALLAGSGLLVLRRRN